MSPPLLPQDITMTETEETVLDLLGELVAIVRGECPSLLNEDSGGSAELSMRIDAALSRAPEVEELGSSTRMTSPASRSQTPLSTGGRDRLRALIWMGWKEMNAVRAATGAPRGYDGYSLGCSEDWWSDMVDAMGAELGDDAKPWPSDAMRPIIDAIAGRRPIPEDKDLSGAQRSELARLAQDEPVSSPPSTGGEGEAVALKTTGWAALAQNRNIRLWSADFDTVHTFAMFNGCEVVRLVSPSPEMGEISRDAERYRFLRNRDAGPASHTPPGPFIGVVPENLILTEDDADEAVDAAMSKLKENGLSREELGGSARAGSGAAGPSDCAEGDARLSDGGEA